MRHFTLSASHCVGTHTHGAGGWKGRRNPQLGGNPYRAKINSPGRAGPFLQQPHQRSCIFDACSNRPHLQYRRSHTQNFSTCWKRERDMLNPFLRAPPSGFNSSVYTRGEKWLRERRFISFLLNWKFSVGFANGFAVAPKDTGVTFPFQRQGVNDGF